MMSNHPEAALAASEQRFRILTTLAPAGIFEADAAGQYVFVNERWQSLTGLSAAQAAGRGWAEALHPEDRAPVLSAWDAAVAAGQPFDVEFRFQPAPGRVVWVHAAATVSHGPRGEAAGYIGTVTDITESMAAEQALTVANERLILSLAEIDQRHRASVLLNEMSSRLQSCLTATAAARLIGDYLPQLFPARAGLVSLTDPAKNISESIAVWGAAGGASERFAVAECWALRQGRLFDSGDPAAAGQACQHVGRPAAHLCAPLLAQEETLGVLTLLESNPAAAFTEGERQLAQTVADSLALALANIRLRETLRDQSMRDALTGLFNRRYMEETLEREVRRAARAQSPIGLVVLDLDHFKRFNDSFGHGAGDALLREVGAFLRQHVRGEDVACRFGGEEFVLILPGAPAATVHQRAEAIRQGLAGLRVTYCGQALGALTASLGVAVFPEHAASPAGLLNAADAALYHAKRHGRNQVVIAAAGA